VRGRGQLITAPVISCANADPTSYDDATQQGNDGASCAAVAAKPVLWVPS